MLPGCVCINFPKKKKKVVKIGNSAPLLNEINLYIYCVPTSRRLRVVDWDRNRGGSIKILTFGKLLTTTYVYVYILFI